MKTLFLCALLFLLFHWALTSCSVAIGTGNGVLEVGNSEDAEALENANELSLWGDLVSIGKKIVSDITPVTKCQDCTLTCDGFVPGCMAKLGNVMFPSGHCQTFNGQPWINGDSCALLECPNDLSLTLAKALLEWECKRVCSIRPPPSYTHLDDTLCSWVQKI